MAGKAGTLMHLKYKLVIPIFQEYLLEVERDLASKATFSRVYCGLCRYLDMHPAFKSYRVDSYVFIPALRSSMHHDGVVGPWLPPEEPYLSEEEGPAPERLAFVKAALVFMQEKLDELSSGG